MEGVIRRRTENILYFPSTTLKDLMRDHGERSALEVLQLAATLTPLQARNHLAKMGLNNDLGLHKIRTLSAGKRVRLWFARELIQRPSPSLLVLDEVTENVDRETRDSLIDLCESFKGALLVVSHDPDFCEPCLFTKVWTLHQQGLHVTHFPSKI